MNRKSLDLKNLIDGLSMSCLAESKNQKTIEWYSSYLAIFNKFLERH